MTNILLNNISIDELKSISNNFKKSTYFVFYTYRKQKYGLATIEDDTNKSIHYYLLDDDACNKIINYNEDKKMYFKMFDPNKYVFFGTHYMISNILSYIFGFNPAFNYNSFNYIDNGEQKYKIDNIQKISDEIINNENNFNIYLKSYSKNNEFYGISINSYDKFIKFIYKKLNIFHSNNKLLNIINDIIDTSMNISNTLKYNTPITFSKSNFLRNIHKYFPKEYNSILNIFECTDSLENINLKDIKNKNTKASDIIVYSIVKHAITNYFLNFSSTEISRITSFKKIGVENFECGKIFTVDKFSVEKLKNKFYLKFRNDNNKNIIDYFSILNNEYYPEYLNKEIYELNKETFDELQPFLNKLKSINIKKYDSLMSYLNFNIVDKDIKKIKPILIKLSSNFYKSFEVLDMYYENLISYKSLQNRNNTDYYDKFSTFLRNINFKKFEILTFNNINNKVWIINKKEFKKCNIELSVEIEDNLDYEIYYFYFKCGNNKILLFSTNDTKSLKFIISDFSGLVTEESFNKWKLYFDLKM